MKGVGAQNHKPTIPPGEGRVTAESAFASAVEERETETDPAGRGPDPAEEVVPDPAPD